MVKTRQRRPDKRRGRPVPRWLLPVGIGLAIAGVAFVLSTGGQAGQVAWATLRTQDVHSLAFVGGDPEHVVFGHHGGLLESRDGGRTWSSLPVRDDAMSTVPADDGSIVIAGHNVLTASRDGGATWAAIRADLPNLDIHGFARDPADPARMWAYLATGGLWQSLDSGAHWIEVRADNVVFPVAVSDPNETRLLGVDATGLITSTDGGRTWATLGAPAAYPITSLAASRDGRSVFVGGTEGLFRSDDGGRTWAPTSYRGSVFALAVTPDGGSIALVSRETGYFRSADRGASWPGP